MAVDNLHTRDQGLHAESHLWLGLANTSTSVKMGDRSWFSLNLNKEVVSEVTISCIKPDKSFTVLYLFASLLLSVLTYIIISYSQISYCSSLF